jgi:NTP pyrophosphatase (non-canonical NTP hydrolase)
MEFNEYQERAKETAMYPNKLDGGFFYTALALAGEVGELLNKIKKIARDNIQIKREEIISELGDILWYLSETARNFNISLEEVAEYNLKKIRSRKERGTLQGSGDNR